MTCPHEKFEVSFKGKFSVFLPLKNTFCSRENVIGNISEGTYR